MPWRFLLSGSAGLKMGFATMTPRIARILQLDHRLRDAPSDSSPAFELLVTEQPYALACWAPRARDHDSSLHRGQCCLVSRWCLTRGLGHALLMRDSS